MEIKIGDTVALRGDKRMNYIGNGKYVCAYTDDQLVDGKYVRHTGHGGIWTGVVERIDGDMVKVAGAWRGIGMVEVLSRG